MLSGLYAPSSGTAQVSGYDILTQMEDVYLNIGICPQHDILWPDLTVEEHLLFYARLRGVSPEEESVKVQEAIANVELVEFKNRQSKRLSGGQKRRLSIAIALIGDVPLIFLYAYTALGLTLGMNQRRDWILKCAVQFGPSFRTPSKAKLSC
jgi:ABC-type multidrug transport system ATPase subunit